MNKRSGKMKIKMKIKKILNWIKDQILIWIIGKLLEIISEKLI